MRPGQVSKAERLTTKISKFAQHAIAGDYEHVKEFASDVRKLGMPVEHAPQISQLLKLGTQTYEDLKVGVGREVRAKEIRACNNSSNVSPL